MLNGKLRIAPTCYHVLHLFPVMSAHEMGFFYDEGLKSEDGAPGYEIPRQAMVPFGFCRDMPKNFEYIRQLEKRLRYDSADPEERKIKISSAAPVDLEAMPFPINGLATGFEDMLAEEEKLGELNYEVPQIKDVCAQDLVAEAYKELTDRQELQEEYQRVSAVAQKWGY